jgi:hypothetical protein
MAFDKIAFISSEHRKICKRILGARYDKRIFDETQRWIDNKGGGGHRFAHGHNREAEVYIKEHWGDIGVEMYRIHILADRLQDRLSDLIKEELKQIGSQGKFPYFENDDEGMVPYCRSVGAESLPADPNARITAVLDPKKGHCENCGSKEDLSLDKSWIRGFLCQKCISRRGLGVCGNCRSLFCSAQSKPLSRKDRFGKCSVCQDTEICS